MNVRDTKLKLEKYERDFQEDKIAISIIVLAGILDEVSVHLEEIANKMYE